MVQKKVDPRVRELIETSVKLRQRGLFVLVGDHGKDQVVNLHLMLSKTQVKARPSVLWCYKKELGFSTHRKKRMRQIKKAVSRGTHDPTTDDPFDLFISQVRGVCVGEGGRNEPWLCRHRHHHKAAPPRPLTEPT